MHSVDLGISEADIASNDPTKYIWQYDVNAYKSNLLVKALNCLTC